jgi:hypothetical protein
MPASDLFNGPADAEFRLRNTYIVVGKTPYLIKDVSPYPGFKKAVLLLMDVCSGVHREAPLCRLPLRAMYDCPHGYLRGVWYSRGTPRHRFQGITNSSFYGLYEEDVILGYSGDVGDLLLNLLSQPRVASRKKSRGIVTRDVYIRESGTVLVRGLPVGEYNAGKLETSLELPSYYLELLRNARITV